MHERTMFDPPEPPEDASVILLITEDQKAMVMNELHRLFIFHGKRLSDEERGMFATELCSGDLPYKAIIAGIRELQKEKLKAVTYYDLRESCQKFAAVDYKPMPCEHCVNGRVLMRRIDTSFSGNVTSFACICENGKRWIHSAPRLPRWNGLHAQTVTDRHPLRVQEPVTFAKVS